MNKVEYYLALKEDVNYKVYVHICKIKNKYGNYGAYFGITCLSLKERWRPQGKGYIGRNRRNREHTYFYKAILKHGWDNFEHILLLDGLTSSMAKWFEKKFIANNKTNCDIYGYNSTDGGESATPNDKVKEKLRIKNTGKRHTKEVKEKLSLLNSGKNNPRAKTIICLNDKNIFYTVKECLSFYSMDRSGILKNINDKFISPKRKFTYLSIYNKMLEDGYTDDFIYKNYNHLIKEKYFNYIEHTSVNNSKYGKDNNKSVQIICLNDGKIFESARECSKFYNKDFSGILKNCNGKYKEPEFKFMKLKLYNLLIKSGKDNDFIFKNHQDLILTNNVS